MRCFWGILSTALLCLSAGLAADQEALPVINIRFDPPRGQPLTVEQRQPLIEVRPGDPLDREALRRTIHNLFGTGRYANIEAHVDRSESGVTLTFHTQSNWFIGEVRVSGVDAPPSTNQLANATKLELGELYTERKEALAIQNLRRLLTANGFIEPLIQVITSEHSETQQIDVLLEVRHGQRAGFGKVILTPGSDLEAEEFRRVAKWKRGKPATALRTENGLGRVEENLQKQDFWQAEADLLTRDYNADANEVNLIAGVTAGRKVVARAEGFEISQKKLRQLVPIFEEGVVDDDLLIEGARAIESFLQTQGYFFAKANYRIERDLPDNAASVVYLVEPGRRQQLAKVEVNGVRFFDEQTIRERIVIAESSLQQRRGRFSLAQLDQDAAAIRNLYLTNGFRDVSVDPRLEPDFNGNADQAAVYFDIEEGSPTFVEKLEVEGMDQFPSGRDNFLFASAEGQPFSVLSIATDRDLILGEYFDAGYQDASFAWADRPGDSEDAVIVRYKIDEGRRLYVDRTLVSGLEHTDEEVVRTQILLRPDEPLSQAAIFETQRRLYELGIFNKVDIDLQNPDGDERKKTVLVNVEEARRWTFNFGGGAEFARIGGNTGDLSSPVGDASFSPRLTFEAHRINFRGKGDTMSFRSRVSNLQQRALWTYENPRWIDSEDWRLTFSGLYDTSRNVRTFSVRRLEGALQLEQRISKPSTMLYRYTYRRTAIEEGSLQISPELIPLISQPVRAALISTTFIEDRRDDPLNSTAGVFNSVDLSVASGVLGSQPDFFRFFGQNTSYHRIKGRMVFARTFQLGLMAPWGSIAPGLAADPLGFAAPDSRIPLAERFFAGGANSHRGFPVNQAGPRDPTTGFPLGGGSELLNSVELRFPLLGDNIGGVLFHDAGNVYSRPSEIAFGSSQDRGVDAEGEQRFDFDYMVHAVGMGLRYRTPVGPVRIDLAYSVNPPRFVGFDGTREQLLNGTGVFREQRISHFQFHFSLGQTF